jgi:hypothetical protein
LDSEELTYDRAFNAASGGADVSEFAQTDGFLGAIEDATAVRIAQTERQVPDDKYYKLLFCGELFSLAYVKSGFGQRSVVLQCLDFSNMWDTNYLYTLKWDNQSSGDGQGSAVVGNQTTFLGANAATDDIINSPDRVIADMAARRKTSNNPALHGSTGIVGSLFSILELLGGVQGKHFGANAWATIQERRVRLMDQLGGDSGETAAKLFEQSVFESWILDKLGGGGSVISFRDLINLINRYIYYDVVPNPVGRYLPGDNTIPKWVTIDQRLAESGLVGKNSSNPGVSHFTAGSIFESGDTGAVQKASRGKLNPYFRSKVDEVERELVSKGWNGSSPAKPQPRETSLFRADSKWHHGLGHAADISVVGIYTGFNGKILYADGYDNYDVAKKSMYGRLHYHYKFDGVDSPALPEDFTTIKTLTSFFTAYGQAVKAVGGQIKWGGDWGTPGVDENGTKYRLGHAGKSAFREYVFASEGLGWDPVHMQTTWSTTQIREAQAAGNYLGMEYLDTEDSAAVGDNEVTVGGPPAVAVGTTSDATPASADVEPGEPELPRERLITQLFRPDVWFVPPPACNIIFPEEYTTFSFNRQMMRETTRLQLTTFNALYEDAIVNQYYFAPSFEGIESLTVGGLGSASKAMLYPHEKFSGIIPKMERISEISFYSKLDPSAISPLFTPTPEGGLDEGNTGKEGSAANVIEHYAEQVAAYNFLTGRYASRSGNVTGRFMPRLVAGYPTLIVNRPEGGGLEPLHFLGLVVGVSHTISQGGGNTSATLSHVRSHKTGTRTDDLFSAALQDSDNILGIQKQEGERIETIITAPISSSSDEPMAASDFYMFNWAKKLIKVERLVEGIQRDGTTEEGAEAAALLAGNSLASPPAALRGPNGGPVVEIIVAEEDRPDATILVFGLRPGSTGTFGVTFTFTKITIIEEFEGGTIPLEEAIRPPWFSDEYSNTNIGPQVYENLLGCPSLVDSATPPAEGYTTLSIETATEALVLDYTAHSDGQQANDYIYGTTRRGFATMQEVLDSFHKQAFGTKGDLDGLDIVGNNLTIQFGDFEEQQITDKDAVTLDPRVERRQRVNDYLRELLTSQGLRG